MSARSGQTEPNSPALTPATKDESGARDLGISVRTYRKHVASLMPRLQATNRFQAALLARERGWF